MGKGVGLDGTGQERESVGIEESERVCVWKRWKVRKAECAVSGAGCEEAVGGESE